MPARRKHVTRKPTIDSGEVRVDGHVIAYTIRRSARRTRTIGVTVTPDRQVVVLAPLDVRAAEAEDLVRRKAEWIVARLSAPAVELPPVTRIGERDSIPFLGAEIPLEVVDVSGRRAHALRTGHPLRVSVPAIAEGSERDRLIEVSVLRWYAALAHSEVSKSVARWAPVVGVKPRELLIRNQKRRWGSCSTDGTLRFNWRLVMAEPALIDYVVVHELSHMLHLNHSPAFWAAVATAMPDFATRRAALKKLSESAWLLA